MLKPLAHFILSSFLAMGFCIVSLADSLESQPLHIISRQEWGAQLPRTGISTYEQYGLATPNYTKIVLHNSALGLKAGSAAVREVQNFHMKKNKWSDIGYNFVIDASGFIYEGRSLNFVPAHAGETVEANSSKNIQLDPDYAAIGIVFLASSQQPFTDAQVESAKKLIHYLAIEHSSVNKLITHAEVKNEIIAMGLTPKGDYHAGMCPGSQTKNNILEIKNEFKKIRPN